MQTLGRVGTVGLAGGSVVLFPRFLLWTRIAFVIGAKVMRTLLLLINHRAPIYTNKGGGKHG